MEEPTSERLSKEQLAQDLKALEKRNSEIVEAGLLPQEHASLSVPDIDSIPDSRRDVLAVYAQDATEKLNVFEDLYVRVNTFVKIANALLLHKQISVSQKGLKITNSNGLSLGLEMLSSGNNTKSSSCSICCLERKRIPSSWWTNRKSPCMSLGKGKC